ncbi:DUF4300 family protein [Anaerococcus sp. Marseille-Q5996]|uniref:DUF4300 family protein n=1 Tax=Anaerococcus sp. Marseille-Q5996 TaxID=2972769 RepID=UPI0021C69859|nr:DUF4300 family protein [Anaerococcus sp. Marseille-Q5996]
MKKVYAILLMILFITGCNKNTNTAIPQNDGKRLVYNNLLNKKSKEDLKRIMDASDLDSKNINRFFKQVDFFNKNVSKDLLIDRDYEKADKIKEYDVYAMQDELFKKHPEFTGTNCRINTFGLIGDKIIIENAKDPNLSVVEIDNTSFSSDLVPTLEKNEIEKFNKFYSAIPTENKNDQNFQIKKIKDFWKENGITFPNNKNYSVISVFVFSNIDENTNELFIGHTGVLFHMDDGRYMLVEKLAFTAPYQVVIFESKDDLYDYLMELYDTSNEEYPIKPIIFEDDKVL